MINSSISFLQTVSQKIVNFASETPLVGSVIRSAVTAVHAAGKAFTSQHLPMRSRVQLGCLALMAIGVTAISAANTASCFKRFNGRGHLSRYVPNSEYNYTASSGNSTSESLLCSKITNKIKADFNEITHSHRSIRPFLDISNPLREELINYHGHEYDILIEQLKRQIIHLGNHMRQYNFNTCCTVQKSDDLMANCFEVKAYIIGDHLDPEIKELR